jgi:tetratricopeptide (TPR) repeat protein
MRLSICMIVRNESANLAACLASAAGLSDETIIVDTGSTDDTRAIALRHGARLHRFDWRDDFAAARNEALLHATGDWILSLDADDRIVPISHMRLKALLATLSDDNVGYMMPIVSPAADGGPLGEVLHVRLFRRRAGIRWRYRVHEQIGSSILESGGRLCVTDIGIVHVGYLDGANLESKLRRNLRLLDLELQDGVASGFLHHIRANTLLDLGRTAEALASVHLSEHAFGSERMPSDVYLTKARAYAMERRLNEARDVVETALDACGFDGRLRFMKAELCAAMGQYEASVDILDEHLAAPSVGPLLSSHDRNLSGFRARHLLAMVLLALGHFDRAAREARQVVNERPAYGDAWLTLADALAASGDADAMSEVRDRGTSGEEGRRVRLLVDAIGCRRAGKPEEALSLLAQVPDPASSSAVILCERALALLDANRSHAEIEKAIDGVLAQDALNVCAWAVLRQLRKGMAQVPSRRDTC